MFIFVGEGSLLTEYFDKEKAYNMTRMIYASDFEGLSVSETLYSRISPSQADHQFL